MKIITILTVISIITLMSCGSGDVTKKDKEKPSFRDTVIVSFDEDGPVSLGDEAGRSYVAGKEPMVFNKIGQTQEVNIGDIIEVVFDGIDPGQADLNYSINPKTGKVLIRLVEENFSPVSVFFTDICQVEIIGTGDLPKLYMADSLKGKSQFIVTPVYNDSCEMIGYELRAGSIEDAGCKAGRKNLEKFRDCTDNGNKQGRVSRSRSWKRYFTK